MVAAIEAGAGEVAAVLLTHAHLDHVEGLGVIREYTDAPTYLHPADRDMFDNLPAQAAMFGSVAPSWTHPSGSSRMVRASASGSRCSGSSTRQDIRPGM